MNKDKYNNAYLTNALTTAFQEINKILYRDYIEITRSPIKQNLDQFYKSAINRTKSVIEREFDLPTFLPNEKPSIQLGEKFIFLMPIEGKQNFINGIPHFSTMITINYLDKKLGNIVNIGAGISLTITRKLYFSFSKNTLLYSDKNTEKQHLTLAKKQNISNILVTNHYGNNIQYIKDYIKPTNIRIFGSLGYSIDLLLQDNIDFLFWTKIDDITRDILKLVATTMQFQYIEKENSSNRYILINKFGILKS